MGTVTHRSPDQAEAFCHRSLAMALKQYVFPGEAVNVVDAFGVDANTSR